MDTDITIEPDTLYHFDLGWLAHYDTTILAVITILCAIAAIALLYVKHSVKVLCAITFGFVVLTSAVIVAGHAYDPDKHRDQRITAQTIQHRDEIDHVVQDWLNDYGIQLSTLCQNAYSDSVAVHPIDIHDTVVCGTGPKESIHVIDNRRVIQATLTRQGELQLAMIT